MFARARDWIDDRRVWIAGGLLALVLGAVAVAIFVWLPREVRSRVAERARERFGVAVEIGSVSIGLGGLVLEDVRVASLHGGVEVRLGIVRARGSVFDLARRGAAAVRAIEVEGVDAQVEVDHAGLTASIAEMRRAWSSGAREESAGGRRTYLASAIALQVRDGRGVLVELRDGKAEGGGARLRVELPTVSVGGADADHGSLSAVKMTASRDAAGWRVDEVEVGSAEMTWVPSAGTAGQGAQPIDRVRAALSGASIARARSALTRFRAEPAAAAGAVVAATTAPRVPRALATTRWTLGSARVRERVGEREQILVEALEGTLVPVAEEGFALKGSGRMTGAGGASWDLRVWPAQARGEGSLEFNGVPLALFLPFLPGFPWFEADRAQVAGRLELNGRGTEGIDVRGRIELANAAVSSPRIAPTPVRGIGVSIEGEGTWYPAATRLEVRRGMVRSGGAQVGITGSAALGLGYYALDVVASLAPTSCGDVLAAIPRDLLGEVSGFGMTGSINGDLALKVDSRALRDTLLTIRVRDGCEFETVPPIADLRRFTVPFLHRVQEPDGTVFEMETGPGSSSWAPLGEISPFFIQAVLAHEDGGFFSHAGFAPSEIRVALIRNLEAGRYVQGASTISMQLAKNIFLRREKTLARKAQEVFLTWWVERALGKAGILELYLNVIEYGPAVYGVRNAALHYFGRTPAELSPAESAFLATVLPNPKAYASHFERGDLSPALTERVRRFLQHMRARGRIDDAALAYGEGELASFRFHREGEAVSERTVLGSAAPLPISDAGGLRLTGVSTEETELPASGEDYPEPEPDQVDY